MPESIPLIVQLLVGASAATSIGTGIYSAVNQPGAPKPATPSPADTALTANATKQNQQASLSQAFPGIQAATGGSLSPEAWIQLSELLSGKAGETGIDASGQDLIKKLLAGGGTGGYSVGVGGGSTSGTGSGLTPTGSSFT